MPLILKPPPTISLQHLIQAWSIYNGSTWGWHPSQRSGRPIHTYKKGGQTIRLKKLKVLLENTTRQRDLNTVINMVRNRHYIAGAGLLASILNDEAQRTADEYQALVDESREKVRAIDAEYDIEKLRRIIREYDRLKLQTSHDNTVNRLKRDMPWHKDNRLHERFHTPYEPANR